MNAGLVCDDLIGGDLNGYRYAREVKDQIALSGAAFALEHQGKARDAVAVYIPRASKEPCERTKRC